MVQPWQRLLKHVWYRSTKMSWVTETEAVELVAGYPVTIPTDYDKWLNLAYLLIFNDNRYSFPSTATANMKLAQSLYGISLATQSGESQALQNGVASFRIGNFSQTFSTQAQLNPNEFPQNVKVLLGEYRVGRPSTIRLSRTYPSN
jgi:hypothetical protein